jgi:hypothetical protein
MEYAAHSEGSYCGSAVLWVFPVYPESIKDK